MFYGYVVDFANIKDEFDKTNQAYFEELQSELGDEVQNYSDIFKSKEDIESDLQNIKNQLFLYDTENVVGFINQINSIDEKGTLLDLKKALEDYKILSNLIRLFGYDELSDHFDIAKSIQLLNEVNNRISIINFKNNIIFKKNIIDTGGKHTAHGATLHNQSFFHNMFIY